MNDFSALLTTEYFRLDIPNGWYALLQMDGFLLPCGMDGGDRKSDKSKAVYSIHSPNGNIQHLRERNLSFVRARGATRAALLTLAYPTALPSDKLKFKWVKIKPSADESQLLDDTRLMARYLSLLEAKTRAAAEQYVDENHSPVRLEQRRFVVSIIGFEQGRVRVLEKKVLTRGEFEILVSETESLTRSTRARAWMV